MIPTLALVYLAKIEISKSQKRTSQYNSYVDSESSCKKEKKLDLSLKKEKKIISLKMFFKKKLRKLKKFVKLKLKLRKYF